LLATCAKIAACGFRLNEASYGSYTYHKFEYQIHLS